MTERRRKAIEGLPWEPTDIHELQIPAHFCQTIDGRPFLLHDSVPDDKNRFLMFSTQENIECLRQHTNWFSDGTFRIVPLNFNQLYTIHSSIEGSILPIVYILIKNRTENSHQQVSEILKDHGCNPTNVMIVLERAAMNAIQLIFPTAALSACFFHLSQCVWQKVQELGLCQEYTDNKEMWITKKKLPALAFVLPGDVAA
uniref:MULE transposase domain-containing protein n=1 Tax=Latimeria chalumnae TaxID=7897 RepID=H3A3Y6_LATCH